MPKSTNSLGSMLRSTKIFCVLASAYFLCSCRDEEAQQRITQLETQLGAQKEIQKNIVEGLVVRDKQFSDRITLIAREVYKDYQEKFTSVDPTGQGFSAILSNNGSFLISCKGAEPYLDGHKLILDIGNPYFMTYIGFVIKAKFGTRAPEYPVDGSREQISKWQKENEEWQKTLVEKELNFPGELAAGAWSKVELILAPSKPEQVAYIALSMRTNEVSLRKPKD